MLFYADVLAAFRWSQSSVEPYSSALFHTQECMYNYFYRTKFVLRTRKGSQWYLKSVEYRDAIKRKETWMT